MPLPIQPLEKASGLSKSWRIQCNTGNATVETTYEFMCWDDIIRSHWQCNEVILLAQYMLANFARGMAEHIRGSDNGELSIVGHSTGTIIAVSAPARALTMEPEIKQGLARVSLITLGRCIPILSLPPQAQRFRDELAIIANAEEIDSIDFTAPTDGACFAL